MAEHIVSGAARTSNSEFVQITINGRPVGPERWKMVFGLRDYEVSDYGRVRSIRRNAFLRPHVDTHGYLRLSLPGPVGRKFYRVHQIVLTAFDGERPAGMQGAHLNGDPLENHLWNLKWATPKENLDHQLAHGTRVRGSAVKTAVLNEAVVAVLKARLAKGETVRGLAREFGFHRDTVRDMKNGKTWKHVEASHE